MNDGEVTQTLVSALAETGRSLINSAQTLAPRLGGALVLLLLAWLVGKLARRLTIKLLTWSRLSSVVERSGLSASLEKAGMRGRVEETLGGFMYFVVVLLFVSAAADVMGWSVVSQTLGMLMAYVPNLLAAGMIVAIAVIVSVPAHAVASSFLKELDVPFHRAVAGGVRGIILIAGGLVALRQIGIDTRFLDRNAYMLVAGVVLIVALPLGFGARLVVGNLVSGLYVRRLYRAGQTVCLGERQAVVKSVNEVSVVFESEHGDIYVPHSQLISKGYQA